jgi:potassium-transporting ATPase KdpC subunit
MQSHLRPAIILMMIFTLLTGIAYPLAMTGLAQVLFPSAANGSLLTHGATVIGSALIGQEFSGAGYLHPRPSASGWNAAATGASNLGPTAAALVTTIADRRAIWEAENGAVAPIDAVTASGSGLDPDISPENALAQSDRIAVARGADAAAVRALIENAVQGRTLWLYGEPRVNVLETNLALDLAFPLPASSPDGLNPN